MIFDDIFNDECDKEIYNKKDMWKGSKYEKIKKKSCDHRGKIGEGIISEICKLLSIPSFINGLTNKGKSFDGFIKNKSVEIKTATMGVNKTFQHELSIKPWSSDKIIFLDITPNDAYMTIIKSFTEDECKGKKNTKDGKRTKIKTKIFPKKQITWRGNKGAFKFDFSIKIINKSIKKGICINLTKSSDELIKNFINLNI